MIPTNWCPRCKKNYIGITHRCMPLESKKTESFVWKQRLNYDESEPGHNYHEDESGFAFDVIDWPVIIFKFDDPEMNKTHEITTVHLGDNLVRPRITRLRDITETQMKEQAVRASKILNPTVDDIIDEILKTGKSQPTPVFFPDES